MSNNRVSKVKDILNGYELNHMQAFSTFNIVCDPVERIYCEDGVTIEVC